MSIVSDTDLALYFLEEFEKVLVDKINEKGIKLYGNTLDVEKLDDLHKLLIREVIPTIKRYFDY